MTNVQPTPTGEPATTLVDIDTYAEMKGISSRTVRRRIDSGQIRNAIHDGRQYLIPVDADPTTLATVTRVNVTANDKQLAKQAAQIVGRLATLDQVAELLGTTVGGVRRMGDAGILVIGPFGRRGALRVFFPPTGER